MQQPRHSFPVSHLSLKYVRLFFGQIFNYEHFKIVFSVSPPPTLLDVTSLNLHWETNFCALISQIGLRRVQQYTVILLGCSMVVRTWSCLEDCLIRSCIDVIVVRVKVSRGFEPFSPMEINRAETSLPPNGEICMDKSHLLPNNPARQ